TLEKLIQLADYSFILFTNALCPCVIARFTNQPPNLASHIVEYITPKVTRVDLRQGVIPITPCERKEIPLRSLLGAATQKMATIAWKSRFWGTQRDLKFLNHLFALPKLADMVDQLSQTRGKRKNQWVAGEGCKPWSLDSKKKSDRILRPFREPGDNWYKKDSFITPKGVEGQIFLPQLICDTVSTHFAAKGYSTEKLYSKPPAALFTPPLVLFNRGFTDAAFFDYPVRFQHALRSVAGEAGAEDQLMFLAAYLRSKLARYFAFHTSASLGSERDQVHTYEVLQLPFYLPGDENEVTPSSKSLMHQVVSKLKSLKKRAEESAAKMEERLNPTAFRLNYSDEGDREEEYSKWLAEWAAKTAKMQAEIEPLLYEYFGIIGQEQALVEDTCDIFDRSDTPPAVDAPMPTLEPLGSDGLENYAQMLTGTLREWSRGQTLNLSMTAGVESQLGVALLRVEQTKGSRVFRTAPLAKEFAEAIKRLETAATVVNGSIKYVQDETWYFEDSNIYIAKPALRGRWTRTVALNDAAEIHANIQSSRRSKS
ncbi:MAG: hypothetical protein WCS42_16285, partial [Verrucomicrobiota bacterium]